MRASVKHFQVLGMSYLQFTKLFFWIFFVPYYKGFYDSTKIVPWTHISNNYWIGAIAPYSAYWYLFYHLFTLGGYYLFGLLMWLVDTVFVYTISRFQHPLYSLGFSISTYFLIALSPGDVLIVWIASLGKVKWFMSIFALITKLPVPAPPAVWSFILTTSIPENQGIALWRYILISLWIIHPLFYKVRSILK